MEGGELLVSGVQVVTTPECFEAAKELGTLSTRATGAGESGAPGGRAVAAEAAAAAAALPAWALRPRKLYTVASGSVVVVAHATQFFVLNNGVVAHSKESAFSLAKANKILSTAASTVIDAAGAPNGAALNAAKAFHKSLTHNNKKNLVAYFKVEAGEEYSVSLMFVERDTAVVAGQRTMSVLVNGAVKVATVDTVAAVGYNKVNTVTFLHTATTGDLTITVKPTGALNPVLSVLDISGPGVAAAGPIFRNVALTATSTAPLKLACKALTGWAAMSKYMEAGFKNFVNKQTVTGVPTAEQKLWQNTCWRQGTLTIVIPTVPGVPLTIEFLASEAFHSVAAARIFDIVIDGVPKVDDLDVLADAGGPDLPSVTQMTHTPAGYLMTIELIGSQDNPTLNGLVITSGTLQPAPVPPAPAPAPAPEPATPPVNVVPPPPPTWEPPPGVAACVPPNVLGGSSSIVEAAPGAVGFGDVDPGNPSGSTLSVLLTNPGTITRSVTHISCPAVQGAITTWFTAQFGTSASVQCAGSTKVPLTTPYSLPGNGGSKTIAVLFTPEGASEAGATLTLWDTTTELVAVALSGRGGDPYANSHTLHPVLNALPVFPAPAADDGATVYLDGTQSHTHGANDELVTWKWTDVGTGHIIEPEAEVVTCFYPFGAFSVLLTIFDQLGASDSALFTIIVSPNNKVTGTYIRLYDGGGSLSALPAKPVFAMLTPAAFAYLQEPVSGLPNSNVILRMYAKTYFAGGSVTFTLAGVGSGAQVWIAIDGEALGSATGVAVSEGQHFVDVRVALDSADTPLALEIDGVPVPFALSDISTEAPVINEVPTGTSGISAGNSGIIKGFLVGPDSEVTVGGSPATVLQLSTASIEFTYPALAAGGTYALVVTRAGQTSNAVQVTYASAPAPPPPGGASQGGPMSNTPKFARKNVGLPFQPTRVAWCHGKAYVTPAYGPQINVITFDSEYNTVSNVALLNTPEPSSCDGITKCAWSTLGIACSPFESDTNWKLYFSLSKIFAQGGLEPSTFVGPGGAVPYDGYVYSVDMQATTKTAAVLISGLPVSNHDHAVNQLAFLPNGNMLIGIGGQTNTGVPAPKLGYLPESPLSAAVIEADITKSGFVGAITYAWAPFTPNAFKAGKDPNDQRWGDWVVVATGDVAVYASGFRNPFGTTVTRTGKVMVTDNGPNKSFGPILTGVGPAPDYAYQSSVEYGSDDSIHFEGIPQGCHSGHANMQRCRAGNPLECVFVKAGQVVDAPPTRCKHDLFADSATGGIMQYNSMTFNKLRHDHVWVAGYKTAIWRVNPSASPPTLVSDLDDSNYPNHVQGTTDMIHAPGGVQLLADLQAKHIGVVYPNDATVAGSGVPTVYDIVPDRGPKSIPAGGIGFIVGGANFNAIPTGAVVTVTIGGAAATSVAVAGPNWITGKLPPNPTGTCSSDVVVSYPASGTTVALTLPGIFCYQ